MPAPPRISLAVPPARVRHMPYAYSRYLKSMIMLRKLPQVQTPAGKQREVQWEAVLWGATGHPSCTRENAPEIVRRQLHHLCQLLCGCGHPSVV